MPRDDDEQAPGTHERTFEKVPVLKLGFLELSPRISLADLITIIGLMAAGMAAYYDLRNDIAILQRDTVQYGANVHRLDTADASLRMEVRGDLREINGKLDEIQRYLRDQARREHGNGGR